MTLLHRLAGRRMGLALATSALAFAAGSAAADPTGAVYSSNWGDMTISRWDSDSAAGRFDHRSGRFEGMRRGNVVTGYWFQEESGQRCERPRNGSYYYGRAVYRFNADQSAFTGEWSYCDEPASQRWNGERKGGGKAPGVDMGVSALGYVYDSGEWKELTVQRWENGEVSGVFAHGEGRFDGRLTGDRLVGHWYQTSSMQACGTSLSGTEYHGRMEFTFTRDRSAFTGRWGYCEEAPARSWDGKLIRRENVASAASGVAGHAPAAAIPTSTSPATAQGGPLSGVFGRAAQAAGDEAERRVHDQIRSGIGSIFNR